MSDALWKEVKDLAVEVERLKSGMARLQESAEAILSRHEQEIAALKEARAGDEHAGDRS